MCNGYLNFEELSSSFSLPVPVIQKILEYSPDRLSEFAEDGLLTIQGNMIRISKPGMLIVRNIAMAFDPQLEVKQGMYSKTI
jgi:oxygen-independent coproporphyrinogen-3 oxidase